MNKKYLNSVLLVLLIVIWSSVIYKYFGRGKSQQKYADSNTVIPKHSINYKIIKDTFQLKITDRDPFGASPKIKRKKTVTKPVKKTKLKPITKKKISWPTITYHGFVKGENNKTRLILLKVNNRLYRKREKEIIGDITLVKAYNDSLIVALNNNTKTIKK